MFNLNKSEHLVVIRQDELSKTDDCVELLRFAVSSEPVAGIVFDQLSRNPLLPDKTNTVIAVPAEWNAASDRTAINIKFYTAGEQVCFDGLKDIKQSPWFIISNGQFAVKINEEVLNKVLNSLPADVIAVNADYGLLAYREKLRFISDEWIASCRRHYSDSAEPIPIPSDWPHHIFMKKAVAGTALANGVLPDRFTDFVDKCLSKSLKLCAISIAGIAQDLKTKTGLLNLCRRHLDTLSETGALNNGQNMYKQVFGTDAKTSQKARLVGKVLLGKNVQLGQDIVIVGPAVICDNTKIGTAAVINSSIIGPDLSVPANQMLFNQVVQEKQPNWKNLARYNKHSYEQKVFDVLERRFKADNEFKTWPVISYARLMKPIADFIVSLIVLILFAPIVPFIILAIKINSPGPVFFKDKRQGKRGKEFFCLKFRTMIVGADKIQDKLRFVNQIDGPQFKMGDDPRISTVGRFLRNTCIDEIPQFFNVLMGQMSIVGPRPSPESENTMCPSWRYARLSVRPGITGLWQVCRTREPMKDFQEWIYYDTKYVQRLSLKTDLWVCWRTARHMAINFIKQF